VDQRIEVVFLGVTDIDRARDFYVDKAGFVLDYDQRVSDELRFVQLTPPGSACSVTFGEGLTEVPPGMQHVLIVVPDADAAREELLGRGLQVAPVEDLAWGRFVYYADPDGNRWSLQELPKRG